MVLDLWSTERYFIGKCLITNMCACQCILVLGWRRFRWFRWRLRRMLYLNYKKLSQFLPVPSPIWLNHLNWPFPPTHSILSTWFCHWNHIYLLQAQRTGIDWFCTHTSHTSSFSFELCSHFNICYNCSGFGSCGNCHRHTSIYTQASILMVLKVKARKKVNSIANWSVWKSSSIITHREKDEWWNWY